MKIADDATKSGGKVVVHAEYGGEAVTVEVCSAAHDITAEAVEPPGSWAACIADTGANNAVGIGQPGPV